MKFHSCSICWYGESGFLAGQQGELLVFTFGKPFCHPSFRQFMLVSTSVLLYILNPVFWLSGRRVKQAGAAFLFLWWSSSFRDLSKHTGNPMALLLLGSRRGCKLEVGRRGVFTRFSEWATEGVTMVIWHPNVAVEDLGYIEREVKQQRTSK